MGQAAFLRGLIKKSWGKSYPVNVHHKEREKMTPSGEAVRA